MNEYRVVFMKSNKLNRMVRLYIMLPKSYDKTIKKYPVLYMHDGQNLFDDKTSGYGDSWGILESYQNDPLLPELIIVGIESIGETRMDELSPYPFTYDDQETLYGGKADLYYQFLLETVKPYIDETYRTFKNPKNTAVMGSSLGGLSSLYAAVKYQDFFTRIGCVSNAFYVVQEEVEKLVSNANLSSIKKLYLDVGTKETSNSINNEAYVKSNQKVFQILQKKVPVSKLRFEVIDGAIHNEKEWKTRFPEIIKFLFSN